MNNVNSSEDLSSIINVLNDFTLTVLGPLPNNSQLLSLWYKFKPLLAPEGYDPSKVQSFLSSLDHEIPSATFKKPPLSNKYPLETSFENSKEYPQLPQHNGLSRGDSYTKGDTSYELNKKSGNSTQSSNSPAPYGSTSVTHSSHDQNLPKGKISGFTLKQEVQNASKLELKEHSTSAKGSANYVNTSIRNSNGQDTSVDYKHEFLDNRRASRNYEGSLDYIGKTVSEGGVTKMNNLQLSNNDAARVEQPKFPEKPSTTVTGNISAHSKCLPALDYVNTFLGKPYSGAANSSLYTRSILESKQGRNTFYYSMLISHFLHLLSDRSTSLVLSNLYEKVVIRKVQLVYYSNQEKLYESLTTSLKALIHEKIAKPGQTKALQELFLNKFYGDKYFREGLVAVMKELFVDYVSGLDAKTFNAHFKHTKLDKVITAVRTPDSEPTDEMLAVFPNLIEGNIELYYIKASKIENVLYTLQGGKTYKQPQISLLCIAQTQEKKIFHALVTKEQVELLEKIEVKEQPEEEMQEDELKGTVYMSMESHFSGEGEQEQSYIDLEVANTLGDEAKEDKKAQKTTMPKISLNRDFLFSKASELTSFMDKHSEKLSSYVKDKQPSNLTKQTPSQNNSSSPKLNMYPVTKAPSDSSKNSNSNKNSSQSSSGNTTALDTMNNSLAIAKPCVSEKVVAQGPHINIFPPSQDASRDPSSGTNSPLLRPTNVASSNKGGKLPPAKDTLRAITSGGSSIPDSSRNVGGLYVPGIGHKTVGVCTNKSKMANVSQNNSFQGLNVSENIQNIPNTPPSKKGADNEKENRDLSSINIRSPLKNIVVYTHQKDAAFAAVEKEASLVEAIMRNSPDGSGGSDRLIYEDSAC